MILEKDGFYLALKYKAVHPVRKTLETYIYIQNMSNEQILNNALDYYKTNGEFEERFIEYPVVKWVEIKAYEITHNGICERIIYLDEFWKKESLLIKKFEE